MRHALLAVALVSLSACNGITPNALPASPAPVTLIAQNILITPIPGELPVGGGTATVRLEVRTIDGRAVGDVPVMLSVNGGSLGQTALVSDATGHAVTTWEGTASATVRATSATAAGEALLLVRTPPPPIPPSVPPTPTPTPAPTPLPTPPPSPPALEIRVTSDTWAEVNTLAHVSVTATNLNGGESVIAYQWDWEADGTFDETLIESAATHTYSTQGIKTPRVKVTTSTGRTATGNAQIVVYKS